MNAICTYILFNKIFTFLNNVLFSLATKAIRLVTFLFHNFVFYWKLEDQFNYSLKNQYFWNSRIAYISTPGMRVTGIKYRNTHCFLFFLYMWGLQKFIRKHFAGTQSWGMRVTCIKCTNAIFNLFFVTGMYRFGYVGNTCIKYINAHFYDIFLMCTQRWGM